MKKIFFLYAIAGFSALVTAQVPQAFNYQAIVRDNNGQPLMSTLINFRISIYDNFALDTSYVELHYKQTNQLGLVTLQVGAGVAEKGYFPSINWAVPEMHMIVEADINNTGTFTYMGDTRLLTVPYAMVAGKSLESNHNNQHKNGYFFTTTLRDTDVMNGDTLVVAKSGLYLFTVDATGYGLVYNSVSISHGDNDLAMKIYRNGNQVFSLPLADYKKDEGYPTGSYNLTGRQTTIVRNVYLNQGDVITMAIRIGSFGGPPYNTSAMGCLSYEMNLVKIE